MYTCEVEGCLAELGAELFHGPAEPVMNAVSEARMSAIQASKENRLFEGGALKPVKLWERVGELIEGIDPRSKDQTFAEYLARAKVDEETKQLGLAFVEGFNACDARIVGAHSLLRAE